MGKYCTLKSSEWAYSEIIYNVHVAGKRPFGCTNVQTEVKMTCICIPGLTPANSYTAAASLLSSSLNHLPEKL